MESRLDKNTKWLENLADVKGIKTIVRAYWTLDKVLNQVDVNTLRVATTLRKYVASQFKPVVAKAFMITFKGRRIRLQLVGVID